MADFDLSQALDDPVETPRGSFYNDAVDTEDLNFTLKQIISCSHKTMQRVVNLVVAVNRMRSSGTGLSDQQFCNAVFERVIQAKSIESLKSPGKKIEYHRVRSVNECTLCDNAQKALVQVSGGLRLNAITLKAGHCEQKVKFQVSRYITTDSIDKAQPVILTIKKSNLHITCFMKNEKADLQLEECSETDLSRISSDTDMNRFLFYGSIKGISETKFESVSCPGWYISTSSWDDEPVEMCQMDSADRLLSFKIN